MAEYDGRKNMTIISSQQRTDDWDNYKSRADSWPENYQVLTWQTQTLFVLCFMRTKSAIMRIGKVSLVKHINYDGEETARTFFSFLFRLINQVALNRNWTKEQFILNVDIVLRPNIEVMFITTECLMWYLSQAGAG